MQKEMKLSQADKCPICSQKIPIKRKGKWFIMECSRCHVSSVNEKEDSLLANWVRFRAGMQKRTKKYKN
jgi:hypothetical protein